MFQNVVVRNAFSIAEAKGCSEAHFRFAAGQYEEPPLYL